MSGCALVEQPTVTSPCVLLIRSALYTFCKKNVNLEIQKFGKTIEIKKKKTTCMRSVFRAAI